MVAKEGVAEERRGSNPAAGEGIPERPTIAPRPMDIVNNLLF
jgi:hypothetical protein